MANTKLSKEELAKLQELQQKNAALIQELGQISLSEINLEQRKESEFIPAPAEKKGEDEAVVEEVK